MKLILRKLAAIWVVIISFFFTHHAQASSSKDIPSRINTVRKTLQEKIQKDDQVKLKGSEFYEENKLNEWVNWGNWSNWNNWNDWLKWNNWNNWANWGNWKNY